LPPFAQWLVAVECRMSQADREKWNERYAAGAYAQRRQPSDFLTSHIGLLPRGRALDVACGRGRNALFLAAEGFDVDAVDISTVALDHARATGVREALDVNWICQDLDLQLTLPTRTYQLIIMFRFVSMPLLRRLPNYLTRGGVLMVEQHMVWQASPVTGPRSERFRVAPGAMAEALTGMEVLVAEEGLVVEPDGEQAALSRLLVRRSD
jgi:SAM-dependent methyltransferase